MRYFGLAASAAVVCMLAAAMPAQADPAAASVAPADSMSYNAANWPAYQLYRAGKYADAIAAGTAEKSARGYALASAAEIGDAALHIPPCMECVKSAENYARQAIAADPNLPEGHIFLAVALGLDSHIIGSVSALSKGYGNESKANIEEAVKLAPKNARAWGTLGGWNIEVVRAAGSMIASWQYGATPEKGIELFNKGIALDPNNLVLHYQFALSLASLDADKYHDMIQKELADAASLTPDTAYDRMSKKRAEELLALLKAGDKDGFATTAKKYQGFPA
ncbi:MAG TPA: hypothetical protein VGT78_13000 [Rhizomicrobium sp.]|nr:hypothetical protein [Rhizomicrobium sp.]